MFEGKCWRGSSGDLWPKGSIKQEDRMTAKVRTEKSYHPRCTGGALAYYEPAQSLSLRTGFVLDSNFGGIKCLWHGNGVAKGSSCGMLGVLT